MVPRLEIPIDEARVHPNLIGCVYTPRVLVHTSGWLGGHTLHMENLSSPDLSKC
jgi:hypothetical protein